MGLGQLGQWLEKIAPPLAPANVVAGYKYLQTLPRREKDKAVLSMLGRILQKAPEQMAQRLQNPMAVMDFAPWGMMSHISPVYHGSPNSFNIPDMSKATNIHTKQLGIPTFFITPNKAVASSYGKNIMEGSLNEGKMLEINASGKEWYEVLNEVRDNLGWPGKASRKFSEKIDEINRKYDADKLRYEWDTTVSKEEREIIKKLQDDAVKESNELKKKLGLNPTDSLPIFERKYDSVKIRGVRDMAGEPDESVIEQLGGSYHPYSDIYMVFEPERFKINKINDIPVK